MPKFVPFKKEYGYSEADQPNPLRWQLLYYDQPSDTYTAQAGVMRCRDYFNDVVAKIHGYDKICPVYGFDARTVKTNDEGVYILVTHCKEHFLDNVNGVIREVLMKDGLPPVVCMYSFNHEEHILFFPKELWENTYTISFVTAMIRCSNYGRLMPAFEEWPKTAEWKSDAFAVSDNYGFQNILMRNRAKSPKKGFWLFYNEDYNSEKLTHVRMSTVHNCGYLTTLIGNGAK